MNAYDSGRRVMIVDDEPIAVEVARLLVERRGMVAVAIARNGAEATEQLARVGHEVDLMLIDLNMPDFDGIEFLGRLRRSEYTPQVIIVSGALESVRRSAEMLCAPYGVELIGRIDKPLTAVKLDQCLVRLRPLGQMTATAL